MITGTRHFYHHHDRSSVLETFPGLNTRRRRAAVVRQTTVLRVIENTSIEIEGKEYIFNKLIGRGGQGAVYSATRSDGEKFAIKMLVWEESTLTRNRLLHPRADAFLHELDYMLRVKPVSEHFVEFYAVSVEKLLGLVCAFIVMELGTGDLSKMIQTMAARRVNNLTGSGENTFTSNRDRKFVWAQLVAGVKALHTKKIVNTDLKPGNFITFGNKIKLSDLGLALEVDKPGQHYRGAGTPFFSAPEVLHPEKYSKKGSKVSYKADIWSLGVILYYMTYGALPTIPNKYEVGTVNASAPPRGKRATRDPRLLDLLFITLQMNPSNRPNILQLQRHPYTRAQVKFY